MGLGPFRALPEKPKVDSKPVSVWRVARCAGCLTIQSFTDPFCPKCGAVIPRGE